jgi:hypothetical protein
MATDTPASPPPKKAKPPALEDKPLTELIPEHFLPLLRQALAKMGLAELDLQWQNRPLALMGVEDAASYWQIVGSWPGGERQFNLYFWAGTLSGAKGFSWSLGGKPASTLESFMVDERKVTLDLLLLYTLQRLNGQKWLLGN